MTIKELVKRTVWPYRRHKSRTVRFAFPFMFVVAAMLSANVIDSETRSFIEIESSKQSVRAGERFQVDVYASAHQPVNAVEIDLTFPAEQLEVTGIDVGESVITLWTVDPYVEDNTVVLRGGTFRRGFQGRHLIATINAVAYESGISYFEVENSTFLAGDGTGAEVTVTDSGKTRVQLYVANEDGTLSVAEGGDSDRTITLRIVTDIDGDGEVSLQDISRFLSAWNTRNEIYDFSGDGRMTFRDFAIILADSFSR